MNFAELISRYEYKLCFLIGVVVILNFAYKQLKLPLPDSLSEEVIPELRGSNVLNSAGRTMFFEAYIYFAFSLVALYVVLCFSENIYQFITEPTEAGSNPAPTFTADSGVWPLTVAVLIVGLGADVPIIKDLEIFFRKLSRYSAGIYRNIIKSKDKLKKIRFSQLPSSAYSLELDQLGKQIAFATAMNGGTAPEIEHFQKVLNRGLMLHHWSLSKTGPVNWGTSAKDNAQSLLGNVANEVQAIRDKIHLKFEQIKEQEVQETSFGAALNEAFPDEFHPRDKDTAKAQEIWARYGMLVGPLFEEMLPSIHALSELSEKNETLFAVLFMQDRFPKFEEDNEPALDVVLQNLRSFSSQVVRNLVVRLSLAVILSTAAVTFFYIVLRELQLGELPNSRIVSSAARIASLQTIGYGVGCIIALICAIAFFRVSEEQLLDVVRREQFFPIGYIAFLFLVTFLVVLTARMVLWGAVNFSSAEKLALLFATLEAVTIIEVLDSIVLSLIGCSFLILLLKLESVSSMFEGQFGKIVIKHALIISLISGIVVFLGFSAVATSDNIWTPARNSKLLYLVLAISVPLISLLSVRQTFLRVARHRGAGQGA